MTCQESLLLFFRCQVIWQLHAQSTDKLAAIELEDDPLNSGPSYELMCSLTGFVGRAPRGERTRGCMDTAAGLSAARQNHLSVTKFGSVNFKVNCL